MKPGETLSQRYFTAISCEFIGEYDDPLFRLFHATSSSLLQTINDQWFLRAAARLEHWVSTSRHGSSPTHKDKQQFPLILTQHRHKQKQAHRFGCSVLLESKTAGNESKVRLQCIHNLNWSVLCHAPKASKPSLSMMKLEQMTMLYRVTVCPSPPLFSTNI